MRELKPDLVHCNSATTRYTFRAALAAKRCRIPFVWHNRLFKIAEKSPVILKKIGKQFEMPSQKLRTLPVLPGI